jgi:hypothetical protein
LNRPTHSLQPTHNTQHYQILYHTAAAVSGIQHSPGTLCTSCTSCQELVLYRFTSWHPALHVSVLCTTRTSCLRSRSFHDIPFISQSPFKVAHPRSHHSPSGPISLYLTAVTPSCHPHIHNPYNTHTITLHKLLGLDSVSFSRSVTTSCLDLRIPSSYPSHIHPPASCRIKFILHLHTYIVTKPRSALKSASGSPRSAHHYFLDPSLPASFFRVCLCLCCPSVPWDLSVGNGWE